MPAALSSPPRFRLRADLSGDERGVSETLGSVLLVVMAVAMLGAFGTLVMSTVASDTPTPPAGTFSVQPKEGESFLLVRHVSGSHLDLAGTHVLLRSNGTDIHGAISLVDGTGAEEWAPGETLRIDLSSGTLRSDARLFLMVIDDATGKTVGTAWATVPGDLTGTAILRNALAATLAFDRTQLTADGLTFVNATVRVSSDLGILLVDRVTLDLSNVGGAAAVPMLDDGVSPDPVGNDGEFTARFAVSNFTFTSLPGFSNQTVTADVADVVGRTARADARLFLTSPPVSKVGMGTEFRNVGSSGVISTTGFLNLTGFTFRDATRVDKDQIEVRVSDLADPTRTWSALVTFDDAEDDGDGACPTPSVTSLILRRDGVAGSVEYVPTGGCFAVDGDARLNLANIRSSTDASLATATWDASGDEAPYQYGAAGIGASNEALIAYFGDITTTAPLATGLGQADLTWAPPTGAASAPSAITSLAGAGEDGAVALSWTSPSSGGSAITSYEIWRDGVRIDTIGANTSYRAAGLTNGQSYTFQVRAVNAVGTSAPSNSVLATPAALPGVPQAFTAEPTIARAYLNWSAPLTDGGFAVTSYRIYLNGTLHATIGSNTSFVALGLEHRSTYAWQVAAVTSQGEGARTATMSTTTPGVPSPPADLAAAAGDRLVTLTWSAPDANGRPITSYRILRDGTPIDTIGTNLSYVAGQLQNGVTYTFAIVAVNEVGASAPSTVAATPASSATVPGSPATFSVARGNGSAFVDWSAPASDGGSAVAAYRIYRNGTLLDEIGINTTYVASGLVNGVAYSFEVSAVNAIGEGPRTSALAVTPGAAPYPPSALAATAGNRTVTLSWTAPAVDGGSALTGFRIYDASTGSLLATTTNGANTSFAVHGLANGTVYSFRVAALNAIGESGPSNTATATPAGAPFPPSALAATSSNASVALTWALPSSDGGSAITGFRVVNASNGATIATTSSGANTTFTVHGLANGHAYSFAVAAVNARGVSSASNAALATPLSVPFPPAGLSASNSTFAVNLSWSAPSSNGGSPVTGYHVYRNGSLLATIGTNTTFSDRAALDNVPYAYTVRAVNAIGASGASNAASGSRTVTAFAISCASMTVAAGSIDSCTSLQEADGVFAGLQEPAGGSNKMFNASFAIDVAGVTGTQTLEMNGYQSQGGENLLIYALNVGTGVYELIATLDSSSSPNNILTFSGTVSSAKHFPAGTLTLRLVDAGPDPNRSSWSLDFVRMVSA